MERSKIPMLSRFDALSHIMPYYGKTHRAFYLLSSLCSETRSKLDEFYDEFVTCMTKYWMFLYINSPKRLNQLFLPNDLFKVSLFGLSPSSIEVLIKIIENLRDSKGWYFNNHWMHSKIKIRDPIRVEINDVKKLHAYVHLLKSTQVILCKMDAYSSKFEYESSTLDTNCNHTSILLKSADINM